MKRILFDIEGDGLLQDITKIHCIATVDVDTGKRWVFGPTQVRLGVEYLSDADLLIAHFGIGYDFPALAKVLRFEVPTTKQLDTVVLSRLKWPNLKEIDGAKAKARLQRGLETLGKLTGSHSLEAWGIRLNQAKLHTDITDWSTWTPEIQERCVGDVTTAWELWKVLDVDKMPQAPIELEHRIQRLCTQITAAGWPFDERKAFALHALLLEEKYGLEKQLKQEFGGWWAPKGLNKGLFIPKRDSAARGYVAGAQFTKIEWVEFNPQSRQHIERCLRKVGWIPEEFTDNGAAKLDEEILDSIAAEYPQAQGLTRYLMLCKRLGQLVEGDKAWLRFVKDGKIHGSYNPMGTVTSRASHYDPNIAQVPAASSPFGKECRELFTVLEGWEIVGADMAGLEGRCLAHYLAKHDDGAYGKLMLEGDPHWKVVEAIGFLEGPRDKHNQLHTILRETGAKRGFYAMLYGCGNEKMGRIIVEACRAAKKVNPEWGFVYDKFFTTESPGKKALQKAGGQAKRDVIEGIEGFGRLITSIMGAETLPGLDGRRIPIRSDHAALNSLLQSAGAILCKRWICDAYEALVAEGLKWGWNGDFVFLGWIHDELQVACRNGLGDRVGRVLTCAAQKAGDSYGFRIPLDSSYKLGQTWADTH